LYCGENLEYGFDRTSATTWILVSRMIAENCSIGWFEWPSVKMTVGLGAVLMPCYSQPAAVLVSGGVVAEADRCASPRRRGGRSRHRRRIPTGPASAILIRGSSSRTTSLRATSPAAILYVGSTAFETVPLHVNDRHSGIGHDAGDCGALGQLFKPDYRSTPLDHCRRHPRRRSDLRPRRRSLPRRHRRSRRAWAPGSRISPWQTRLVRSKHSFGP